MMLDGYIRVSRVNGRKGPSYISPEVQRDAIQGWVEAHGHEIAEWHKEEDRSGGAGKKRPVFEAVMARVIGGESQGIVVWKLSRFGRSLLESATRLHKIEEAGGVVESATEGEQSKLTRNIMLAIAEDELDRLTESWLEARKRAVERGVWIGEASIGYRRTEEGTLEPDPETEAIVREVFRIAAAEGLHAAMRYLQREVPARRWRTDEVRRLLRSRAYLGEVFHGELVKTGAHEPLTTPERFAAVQALPEMTARPKRKGGEYPLSGIATCVCGATMIGGLQSVHGRRYRRMRCSDTKCRGGSSISADKLEAYVKDRVGVALGARASHARFPGVDLANAREALESAQGDLQRWRDDDRARAILGDQDFYAGLEPRVAKVKEAAQRYRDVASQKARSEVLPAITDLEDPEQFERALRVMVKDVKVSRGRASVADRVKIVWDGGFATLQKSPFDAPVDEHTIERGMKALAEGQRQRHPGAEIE